MYAWFLYGHMTVTWTIDKDFKQLFRYHKDGIALSQKNSLGFLLTELIVSKIIYYMYILVIPILFLPVPWWMILFFYFSMHFVSGFSLGIIFQTAHVMPASEYPMPDEKGNVENNWAIHQLMTTSNYSPKNRWFSWFIGALNYQVEHHLFPNICHVHYKNISGLVKTVAHKYNLPYHVQPNFLTAIRNHSKMLKILGR
ncbi:fatty acid desaturase family protein [Bacteroidota bacterium]